MSGFNHFCRTREQGYRVRSKVGLSFIQRVEFQTNKCLYGNEMTQSETTAGKKDHQGQQDRPAQP